MSDQPKPAIGSIGWTDLTIANAGQLRDFYSAVVGWKSDGLDMGGYQDYVMAEPDSGKPTAGVCHAKGSNEGLPSVWLVYFTVADLEASLTATTAQGGTVLRQPTNAGGQGRYAVIRDPAGAVAALYQSN